jgi:TolB protein
MVVFPRWQRLLAVVLCCFCTQLATAGSFEVQQKNTTIFDGVKGEVGDLRLDNTQTNYYWNSSSPATDAHGFQYRRFAKDFILTTQMRALPPGRALFGLQVDGQNADEFSLKTRLDAYGNLVVISCRDKKATYPLLAKVRNPDVFQLERHGNELLFSAANFGKPLQLVSRILLPQAIPLDVGVYRSFAAGDKTPVEMRNLRWIIPAWEGLVPYKDYIGSRLEILDVFTGERSVIYETAAGIEAPNWTADGDNIIYDSAGRVYKLHLPSKKIVMVNTGFEIRTNNDHVVSYGGKTLGITHLDSAAKDSWTIYKLPITGYGTGHGTEPLQLTFIKPSYLHGWSPDGRYVLYTSQRDGKFKIYRGNSDGSGGEVQLTFGDSMDDGSEYTPDGKYIYFNSTRGGGMNIWRMDADGKNPKQITNDSFHDWFPHISPDGKHLAFLTFLPEVQPDLHPYYQQVYLRLMPIAGGEPKVIAYVYGGQGTFNVPSWSPDGRYVAFVSNSQLGAEKP